LWTHTTQWFQGNNFFSSVASRKLVGNKRVGHGKELRVGISLELSKRHFGVGIMSLFIKYFFFLPLVNFVPKYISIELIYCHGTNMDIGMTNLLCICLTIHGHKENKGPWMLKNCHCRDMVTKTCKGNIITMR